MYDVGGQGYRIKKAFDAYQPDFSVRSIHTMESFPRYPHDLAKGSPEVKGLLEQVDILHLCNGVEDLPALRKIIGSRPLGIVVHHRGTKFREYHLRLYPAAEAVGAIQVASTLDLTMLEPNVAWLPSPYEIGELAQLREKAPQKGKADPIRVAHAPTNRAVKSTGAVMQAILDLNASGIPMVLDLIERKPWSEVIARKAKADIYVDQLRLGYGNNAIEAWAMGIPVIAGVEDPDVREVMVQTFGHTPFYIADERTLVSRLGDLATDLRLRSHWGEIGKEHVLQYHSAKAVSNRLASIYEAALRKARTLSEQESEVSHG